MKYSDSLIHIAHMKMNQCFVITSFSYRNLFTSLYHLFLFCTLYSHHRLLETKKTDFIILRSFHYQCCYYSHDTHSPANYFQLSTLLYRALIVILDCEFSYMLMLYINLPKMKIK